MLWVWEGWAPWRRGCPGQSGGCPTLFFLPGFMCHVCEEFYNLSCNNPHNCEPGDIFCVTVIVSKLR